MAGIVSGRGTAKGAQEERKTRYVRSRGLYMRKGRARSRADGSRDETRNRGNGVVNIAENYNLLVALMAPE